MGGAQKGRLAEMTVSLTFLSGRAASSADLPFALPFAIA
jgi:hypothetical protein